MRLGNTKHDTEAEEPLGEVKRITEKEGAEGWKLAKETMLDHKTRNPRLKEAISYLVESHPDFYRPALVSLCSRAVRGTSEVTVPCGASLVLLAKAIGIHDDIIDQLKTRDKSRTLFGRYGKNLALILSDILLFKGFALLRKNLEIGVSEGTTARILETIDNVWFEQSEAEMLDAQSQGKIDMTLDQYLTKIRLAASEREAITRIGGILGGGSERKVEDLGKYGRLLGMVSMLRDEVIDMLEMAALRHRIRKESLPLPIIYACQHAEVRSQIVSLISTGRLKTADLWKISKMTDEAGGIDYAAGLTGKFSEEACSIVESFEKERETLKLLARSLVIEPEEWKPILQAR
jgi:geranylgeranyl pyrophosphate synthase